MIWSEYEKLSTKSGLGTYVKWYNIVRTTKDLDRIWLFYYLV